MFFHSNSIICVNANLSLDVTVQTKKEWRQLKQILHIYKAFSRTVNDATQYDGNFCSEMLFKYSDFEELPGKAILIYFRYGVE